MKWLPRIAIFFSTITITALVGIYYVFQSSLPELEGVIDLAAINSNITIERDQHGGATIIGDNREDIAFATGYVHAQERFFQMDLSRRMAAGELSELFGPLAVETDKKNRLHQFRKRASIAQKQLNLSDQKLLKKYVEGVNIGLNGLRSKPFEYWLLSTEPKQWNVEDTFLVIYSMFFTLQSSNGEFEWQNYLLRKTFSPELVSFLLPDMTEWDAPMQVDQIPYVKAKIPAAPSNTKQVIAFDRDDRPVIGSNNWAVSGKLTKSGAAMLSNDMHLAIRAPSIWYKVRLKLEDNSMDVTGVSLAGAPPVVVGSNGFVAWGFTNSNIDTSDLIELSINPQNQNQYLTSEGYKSFDVIEEEIKIIGTASEKFSFKKTIWGPVIKKGQSGNYAFRWVAHMPDAVNASLLNMEYVKNVQDAMDIAGDIGIPAQNAMLVDKDGNAGWTIFGKIPRRPIGDYRHVYNWSDGSRDWRGWYSSEEYPRILNPSNGRLWTANARVLSGDDLAKVGISRYDLGARAKQIRDRLIALEAPIDENDLYNIMLDNEAIFLTRWQQHLVELLETSNEATFKKYLKKIKNWGGFAHKNSVGFRLVRDYRNQVYETLFANVTAACVNYNAECEYDAATRQWEGPLWQLMTERPDDWLPDGFDDWQNFLEKQAFDAWQVVIKGEILLDDYTWGERNSTDIRHPLSGAVPLLSRLTDMPNYRQSGDTENMPHIAGIVSGQSERIVVSPGFEENGIMNLPAGQSGHPLSPYYGSGHDDWLKGIPTPFLPQETKWKLEFRPIN